MERRGREEEARGGEGAAESSYESASAPWRALVRSDAGRPQVDGSICTWVGGSVGMWGDRNDVISKACSIWLDSVALILSNHINALYIEHNWRIICESSTPRRPSRRSTLLLLLLLFLLMLLFCVQQKIHFGEFLLLYMYAWKLHPKVIPARQMFFF